MQGSSNTGHHDGHLGKRRKAFNDAPVRPVEPAPLPTVWDGRTSRPPCTNQTGRQSPPNHQSDNPAKDTAPATLDIHGCGKSGDGTGARGLNPLLPDPDESESLRISVPVYLFYIINGVSDNITKRFGFVEFDHWRNHELRLDCKKDTVLHEMEETGEYKGDHYTVHECVADFFKANEKDFNTIDGTSLGFLIVTKYMENFCMDGDNTIHAVRCDLMKAKTRYPVNIQPREVSPVKIKWIEDEVANELNYRENDGGNERGD
jgi:hypothetical protein